VPLDVVDALAGAVDDEARRIEAAVTPGQAQVVGGQEGGVLVDDAAAHHRDQLWVRGAHGGSLSPASGRP